jgi:hypothetical protein
VVVFDAIPSELPQIYWRCSLNDIRVKLRLYIGYEQSQVFQQFQTMALLLSQAFGGKKKDKEVAQPKTKDELELAFRSVFSP